MAKDEPVKDEQGFCQRVDKGEAMQVLLFLTKSLKKEINSHPVELVWTKKKVSVTLELRIG